MNDIASVLMSVRNKGAALWVENSQLRYKAPKGALTRAEIERLQKSRAQIIAYLEKNACAETTEPMLEQRRPSDPIPLTFSQLSYLNLLEKRKSPNVRQIASATRLCGRMLTEPILQAFEEVLRRHEALRTRIEFVDGIPMQTISEPNVHRLAVDDLGELPSSNQETEIQRLLEQLVLEPIDIAVGPLFGARLLRLRDDEHVLIVAMEHVISDAFSMEIFLRDLLTAYSQAVETSTITLPTLPMQFSDFALWQRTRERSWVEKHGRYWSERLAECKRVPFPRNARSSIAEVVGWGTIPLHISVGLRAKLCDWCKLRRTTLPLCAFTAYVALVLRWCNVTDSVIRYQTNGRAHPNVENTIGFFASVLHLRLELFDGDEFIELLGRVTAEYCNACEHNDFSYVEAQVPRLGFTQNAAFNWVPQKNKSTLSSPDDSQEALTIRAIPFSNPALSRIDLDYEPSILLYDLGNEILGGVFFPFNQFSADEMSRFGRNFMWFLDCLLKQPLVRVRSIPILD
jgi:hypothetical protein